MKMKGGSTRINEAAIGAFRATGEGLIAAGLLGREELDSALDMLAQSGETTGEERPELLTKKEVGALLRVSMRTVERLVLAGKLKPITVGLRTTRPLVRFRRRDVEVLAGLSAKGGRR